MIRFIHFNKVKNFNISEIQETGVEISRNDFPTNSRNRNWPQPSAVSTHSTLNSNPAQYSGISGILALSSYSSSTLSQAGVISPNQSAYEDIAEAVNVCNL